MQPVLHTAERLGTDAGKAVGTAAGLVGKAGSAAAPLVKKGLKLGWRALFAVVGVVVVFVGAMVRSCSGMPSTGRVSVTEALPSLLRSAASCERYNTDGVDKCVIAPSSALLAGDITAGQEFTFYMQQHAPHDQLAATIGRWRTAGGTILSDAAVFLEISPSQTVWYADTRSGFHLETGTFASRSAAETFLMRTGLAT